MVSSPQLNDHHQIIITLNLPDLAGGAALDQGYYWDESRLRFTLPVLGSEGERFRVIFMEDYLP